MNITISRSTILVVAIILALFTPVVGWAFGLVGFVLTIIGAILGAINPLGFVTVTLVVGGLWAYRHLDILFDNEEEWGN